MYIYFLCVLAPGRGARVAGSKWGELKLEDWGDRGGTGRVCDNKFCCQQQVMVMTARDRGV